MDETTKDALAQLLGSTAGTIEADGPAQLFARAPLQRCRPVTGGSAITGLQTF